MEKPGHLMVGALLSIVMGGVSASVVFVAMVGDLLPDRPVITSVETMTVIGRP